MTTEGVSVDPGNCVKSVCGKKESMVKLLNILHTHIKGPAVRVINKQSARTYR